MALNIRRVGEVADGSVTAEKLADNAIDLGTTKVTGSLPSIKLDDGAIIESKLANLSISTEKLKNNVVTLAKADDDIKVSPWAGDETIIFVSGNVESDIKEMSFGKRPGRFSADKLRIMATLQTNNSLYSGSLNVYLNDETGSRATISSNSTTYELVDSEIDISDLGNGRHVITIGMGSDNVSGVTHNDYLDILFVK